MAYTLEGDANLDGTVNALDFDSAGVELRRERRERRLERRVITISTAT